MQKQKWEEIVARIEKEGTWFYFLHSNQTQVDWQRAGEVFVMTSNYYQHESWDYAVGYAPFVHAPSVPELASDGQKWVGSVPYADHQRVKRHSNVLWTEETKKAILSKVLDWKIICTDSGRPFKMFKNIEWVERVGPPSTSELQESYRIIRPGL